MSGLCIRFEAGEKDSITVALEGSFNGQTAAEVRRSLDTLGRRPVVLDFSRVHTFVDLAVGVLMRDLEAPHIQIRGLGGHGERMFRYFGLGAPTPPERAYYTAEEVMAG